MRNFVAGACLLALFGCQSGTGGTIATDAAEAGQLFCSDSTQLMAIAGVNVVGATPAAVAGACAVARVVGVLTPPATTPVPIAAPAGVQAVIATVPAAVAAAVQASKPSKPGAV
jgi:hypothetical protein